MFRVEGFVAALLAQGRGTRAVELKCKKLHMLGTGRVSHRKFVLELLAA